MYLFFNSTIKQQQQTATKGRLLLFQYICSALHTRTLCGRVDKHSVCVCVWKNFLMEQKYFRIFPSNKDVTGTSRNEREKRAQGLWACVCAFQIESNLCMSLYNNSNNKSSFYFKLKTVWLIIKRNAKQYNNIHLKMPEIDLSVLMQGYLRKRLYTMNENSFIHIFHQGYRRFALTLSTFLEHLLSLFGLALSLARNESVSQPTHFACAYTKKGNTHTHAHTKNTHTPKMR